MPRFSLGRFRWKTHFERGMSAGAAGDLHSACKHFRRSVELASDEPYPHYELGYTLFLLGEYQEALSELKRTNQLSLGFFLVQTEIYLCEGVISGLLDESTLSNLRTLQQLTDSGRSDSAEAVALSNDVIDAAPNCALGHFYLGKALFMTERARSEEALERCMELSPDDTTAIDALGHIGLHRREAGDLESANRIWMQVLRTYQGNPHTKLVEMSLGDGRS